MAKSEATWDFLLCVYVACGFCLNAAMSLYSTAFRVQVELQAGIS